MLAAGVCYLRTIPFCAPVRRRGRFCRISHVCTIDKCFNGLQKCTPLLNCMLAADDNPFVCCLYTRVLRLHCRATCEDEGHRISSALHGSRLRQKFAAGSNLKGNEIDVRFDVGSQLPLLRLCPLQLFALQLQLKTT